MKNFKTAKIDKKPKLTEAERIAQANALKAMSGFGKRTQGVFPKT